MPWVHANASTCLSASGAKHICAQLLTPWVLLDLELSSVELIGDTARCSDCGLDRSRVDAGRKV
jgi:hypothetical protein